MTDPERYWLPFTPNRSFKKEPQLLVRADGMYFWNQQGEQLPPIRTATAGSSTTIMR